MSARRTKIVRERERWIQCSHDCTSAFVIIVFDEISMNYVFQFFRMMIEYHTIEKETWEICQSYYKVRTCVRYAWYQNSRPFFFFD